MIPYAKHYISKNDIQKVTKVLKSQKPYSRKREYFIRKKN